MKTAAQWKAFYAEERAALGEEGLRRALERAPAVTFPQGGALVFPHTRMAVTGDLTAAVARALVDAGAEEVLALGVLHGGRAADADRVKRAQGGDADEAASLRRIHHGGDALCAEEFSLDNFEILLALAAATAGRTAPRVLARYPFLVGDNPDIPGIDDLATLARRMPVVATTDPLHHGAGYDTPVGSRRSGEDPATHAWAHGIIARQLDCLESGDWSPFAHLAEDVRSDFRDTGPALFHLLRGGPAPRGEILELRLVDYSEALGAEKPTWVAGPLMRVNAG